MSELADIGVIGLAVMGQNLALNMNDKGYRVAVFNRTYSKTGDFLAGPASGTEISGAETLEAFVSSLSRPRKLILMVRSGKPVDAVIDTLVPLLDSGDIVIDGGNSNFTDTQRRVAELEAKKLLFIGTGISGGEEGARHGPSIMPGGHQDAWPHVKDILQATSAKVGDNEPCCDWVGAGGSGHFVKMVHNGIEYGDMQLICEIYHYMRQVLEMENTDISRAFSEWNQGILGSYLVEITADILNYNEDGEYVVDHILDKAGQKGTGRWTVINALETGTPLTMIAEAVFARGVSALKEQRVAASKILAPPAPSDNRQPHQQATAETLAALGDAMLAAKIVSYAQGFMLLRAASEEHQWDLQYASIASLWRGGCIIRSAFLDDIKRAFDRNASLECLMTDDWFATKLDAAQQHWREITAAAVMAGIPVPALTSALSFYDSYRSENLPANLLQAQRDYFGAHTYERVDRAAGERFHTDWTGQGGDVSSTTYQA